LKPTFFAGIDQATFIQKLVEQHYVYLPNFFEEEFTEVLEEHCTQLFQNGKMRPAKIGKKTQLKRIPQIRGDWIQWIDYESSPHYLKLYQNFLRELQDFLRIELRLALKRFESQFAVYPEGAFYKRHLDQHTQSPHRQISTVLYLNQGADPLASGGELVLYDSFGKVIRTLPPLRGSFICFLSSQLPHEVLKSNFERKTLTSWLRDDELLPLNTF